MTGWIVTRNAADGSKRYDVRVRLAPGKIKSRTFEKWKDANAYLISTTKLVIDGSYVDVKPTTMNEVFDRWIETLEPRVQEGSLKTSAVSSYRSIVAQHLRPAFGTCRSDQLSALAIESWRNEIAEKISTGQMSSKTFANIRMLLGSIITWARHPERAYLNHDPLAGLSKLRLSRAKRREHLEPDQVEALLKLAAQQPPADTIIRVATLSGLRRGEIFSLKWSDLDSGNGRDGGHLHISRGIYHGVISTPKTDGSERVVDIPQRVVDDLEIYRLSYPPCLVTSSSGQRRETPSSRTTGTTGTWSPCSSRSAPTSAASGCTRSGTGTSRCWPPSVKTCTTSAARSATPASG